MKRLPWQLLLLPLPTLLLLAFLPGIIIPISQQGLLFISKRDYYSHFPAAVVRRWLISWQDIATNKLRAVKDSVWSASCRQNRFHELWGNDSFSIILLNFWFCPGYALETSGWRTTIFCEVMSLLFGMITLCLWRSVIFWWSAQPKWYRVRFFGSDGVLRPVPLRSILGDNEDAVLVLLGFLVSTGLINSL